MIKIFKYEIELSDKSFIIMPKDSRILDVQMQHGHIMLWAEVDTLKPVLRVNTYVVGTGFEVPTLITTETLEYISSVQIQEFVWHIYINMTGLRNDS